MYKVVIKTAACWKMCYEYARALGLTVEGTRWDHMNGDCIEWQIVFPSYREADAFASMIRADGPDCFVSNVFVRPIKEEETLPIQGM